MVGAQPVAGAGGYDAGPLCGSACLFVSALRLGNNSVVKSTRSRETVDANASTRRRVAQLIMQAGSATAAVLAKELNLTAAAVRRHLTTLVDDGLLEVREQRVYGTRGRGRPAQVYVLTDAGRADFYQAYDDLAIRALRHLAEAAGPEAVRELAQQRIADVEQRFLAIRAERPEIPPNEALAQALTADGYVASIQPVRSGDQLCQHHCPVAHVAEQFPQLCEVETEVFSRLLGSHVQRLATIAHGDGVCTTHIPKPRKA